MKTCPTCQVSYPPNYAICPADGTPLAEVGAWSEGSVIRGKYKLLAKVGEGGMGAVYRATHLAFDELRAIKVISRELMRDDNFVRRFKKEAVITRRLQHPNAVRVDDIDDAEDGRPFIVMEYIDGKSLKKLIKEEGPLPFLRVLSIIKQSARALDAAHKLGMVHRDIKPDNISLIEGPEGEVVKVLDFGIAKMKEGNMGDDAGNTLTGVGVVIGTPQYMSPEQAMGKRGDELDGRADLYSLGVVMYQMLSADLPFKANTTMEILLAHMQKPPSPIEVAHPELQIPENVRNLTMRLLEKNRDLRPASGRALIQEIDRIEADMSNPVATRMVTPDDLVPTTVAPSQLPPPPPAPRVKTQAVRAVEPQRPVQPVRPVQPPRPPVVLPSLPPPPPPRPHESKWGMWAALAVLLVGLCGFGLYIATRSSANTPAGSTDITATLSADPPSVQKGQSVTLRWSSRGATALEIEPGVGKVEDRGSTVVSPSDTTTYVLTAAGPGGNLQNYSAQVTVTTPPEQQTVITDQKPPASGNDNPPTHKPNPKPPYVPPAPVVDEKAVKGKMTLGDFHLRKYEYDKAIEAYREGLEVDPRNAELKQKLNSAINMCRKESSILGEADKCGSP